MRHQLITLGGISLIWASGFIVGHAITKYRVEMKYHAKLDAELEAARRYYAKLNKRDEFADPTEVVPENHKDDPSEGEIVYGLDSQHPKPEEFNFDADDWEKYARFDYRREIPKRSPEVAYVISLDEHIENDLDHDQTTLTYYAKDDVLVEEPRSTIITNALDVLGPVALDQFGNGSKDPNIVYVRNEELGMDYEVVRDPGSFEEEVLGHIKHGEGPKVWKFRIHDE